MNYVITTRDLYKCSKCYYQFSVKTGTVMENSPLPLMKWFKCIYYLTIFKGISSVDMAEVVGVRQHTAWHMMQRLSAALNAESMIILSGIVEVDESHVGPLLVRNKRLLVAKAIHNKRQKEIHGLTKQEKRRLRGYPITSNRQKGVTKEVIEQRKKEKAHLGNRAMFDRGYYILGMMEREGRVVFRILGETRRSVNKANVHPHLVKYIHKESTLISDESGCYLDAEKHFKEHYSVNHRQTYSFRTTRNGEEFIVHTNGIENLWKNLKKMIRGKHVQFSIHHAQRYLDMFAYRWNRRLKGKRILFEDFIPNLFQERILYRDLKQVKDLTCQGHNQKAA